MHTNIEILNYMAFANAYLLINVENIQNREKK